MKDFLSRKVEMSRVEVKKKNRKKTVKFVQGLFVDPAAEQIGGEWGILWR